MTPVYAQACLAGSVFFWGGGFFSPFRIIYLHIVRQMTKYDIYTLLRKMCLHLASVQASIMCVWCFKFVDYIFYLQEIKKKKTESAHQL